MSRRAGRTWGQRALLAFNGALIVALVTTAAGLAYGWSKYSHLQRIEVGSVLTERAGSDAPQNFLLVGVDSADNLAADDPARQGRGDLGSLRSDTMMILRAEPGTQQAALLSLPRDLWVPLASGGRQRLNVAVQIGGPTELIETIERYLGIPVHHYLQVDFAGFRDLVAAVDGVQVPFEHPARDRRSGLDVPEAGCVTLDPAQALAYVRARHYETYQNGRWRTDPTGDLGRVDRQQEFIVRALRRAIDKGARNPVTLDRLLDVGLATVAVDDLLTADDLLTLGARFRGFDPERLELHSLPVTDAVIGGADVLRLVDDDAQPVLDLFRGTDPADVAPGGVRVRVRNGTGRAGEAAAVSQELAAVGFAVAGADSADRFDVNRTVVRYREGQQAAADLVARHLVAGADLELVDDADLGADVVVVTGADYAGVRPEPVPSTSSPASVPTTQPAPTTEAAPGSTATAGPPPDGDEPVRC